VLILNASIQYRKTWDEITSEEFDDQIKNIETKWIFEIRRRGYEALSTVLH